jgi:hypothetical protein
MSEIKIKSINTDIVDIAVRESTEIMAMAEAQPVRDQASYEAVAGIRSSANAKYKELDAKRKEITKPLDSAKAQIMALFKTPLEKLRQVIDLCDKSLVTYTTEQERIRKAEEARLQAIADKKRAELEAKALKAAEEGKDAKAEKYQEKAQEVIAPVLAPTVEQPKGTYFTERYYGDVIDVNLLPKEYMIPDQSKINKVIAATKGSLQIPGVKVRIEKIVNTRRT